MVFSWKTGVKRYVTFLILAVFVALAGCQPAAQFKQSEPRWWKGNLHMHTLWSDGRAYPEVAANAYKQAGYHFIGMSDHNIIAEGQRWITFNEEKRRKEYFDRYLGAYGDGWVETREVDGKFQVRVKPLNEFRHFVEEPGRFMIIQSEEVTMSYAHLNAINTIQQIDTQKFDNSPDTIRFAVDALEQQCKDTGQPMLIFVNHPNWKWQLTAEDFLDMPGVRFFEVYNGGGESIKNEGDEVHASTDKIWDIILTKRLAELNLPILYAVATDDVHSAMERKPENPKAAYGRGWIQVRSKYLTPESILNAMNTGDFYATNGIVLDDVRFDGHTLTVKAKPQLGVTYTIEFIGTRKGYDPSSQPITYVDQKGNTQNATRKYSDDIGVVFQRSQGHSASYTLRNNDIYVRAKIVSSKLKVNPRIENELEMAWTQPVVFGAVGN